MKAISPATPCTPRCSRPPSTRPIPMPVPTCTKAKLSTSRPWPSARSASAAASTSFSIASPGPNASRRPASASGRSQPGSPPVSAMTSRCRSYTPGLPTTVWMSAAGLIPARSDRSSASSSSSPTRPRTLVALASRDSRARTTPARSATAPRRYRRPMSRPSTNPASGRTSYSSAERPGTPVRCPAMPHQARAFQVGERERDGGLGEPGDARQVGARVGAGRADVLEQQLLVHRPDQRGTRRRQPVDRRRVGRDLCHGASPRCVITV